MLSSDAVVELISDSLKIFQIVSDRTQDGGVCGQAGSSMTGLSPVACDEG